MVLLGTIVNAAAILVGGLIGTAAPVIPERIRTTVMQGMGLAVSVLGAMMAFTSDNFLIVIFSLVLGSILGEWMRLEDGLNKVGHWLERLVGSKGKGNVAEGFITATLVYCVGAMAILGSIDSGLRNNHDVLFTKSMLDGFTSVIFASTLGVGVVFSAIPILIYQGSIALLSTWVFDFVSRQMLDAMIAEMTATGGILIIGIGLNVLEIKKINVINMLPSLVITTVAVPLVSFLSDWWDKVM